MELFRKNLVRLLSRGRNRRAREGKSSNNLKCKEQASIKGFSSAFQRIYLRKTLKHNWDDMS